MYKQPQLHYKKLQRIKAEEYERFFESLDEPYYPYLNHLGELKWMTEEKAEQQHEYFVYTESAFLRLKKKLHLNNASDWDKLSSFERELRLQFRIYLEKKYLREIRPETARLIPEEWQSELSRDQIESIPITLEIYKSLGWNKTLLTAMLVIFVIAGASIYYLFANSQTNGGNIEIKANVRGASVYLNDEKKGYADLTHVLRDVPVGNHRISLVKPGYTANPKSLNVHVTKDTLINVYFEMKPIETSGRGFLKITADYLDSKLFLDNEFQGILDDQSLVPLIPGNHSVSIEKQGFRSQPVEKVVSITAGDTLAVNFRQSSAFSYKPSAGSARNDEILGALEITANVNGGRIFLNGEDTGKETDYVFTEIPLGTYKIKVVREGYQTIPPEHVLTLTRSNTNAEISFELIKEYEQVSIKTRPAEGEIFIDDNSLGTGAYEGALRIGKHELSFGNVPGYKTPSPRAITVQPHAPLELIVDYFPQMQFAAIVSENGILQRDNCEVKTGYTFSDRGFTASEEAGPEIVYHEKLKDYFWKLGFAFPYRNPKGSDALKISFRLPHELNFNQKFSLKMFAAASEEKYPLSMNASVDIKIKFNGTVLSYYYEPKFLEKLNGLEEVEWDISRYIKPGLNSLEISTTEKNNCFYFIKSIRVTN